MRAHLQLFFIASANALETESLGDRRQRNDDDEAFNRIHALANSLHQSALKESRAKVQSELHGLLGPFLHHHFYNFGNETTTTTTTAPVLNETDTTTQLSTVPTTTGFAELTLTPSTIAATTTGDLFETSTEQTQATTTTTAATTFTTGGLDLTDFGESTLPAASVRQQIPLTAAQIAFATSMVPSADDILRIAAWNPHTWSSAQFMALQQRLHQLIQQVHQLTQQLQPTEAPVATAATTLAATEISGFATTRPATTYSQSTVATKLNLLHLLQAERTAFLALIQRIGQFLTSDDANAVQLAQFQYSVAELIEAIQSAWEQIEDDLRAPPQLTYTPGAVTYPYTTSTPLAVASSAPVAYSFSAATPPLITTGTEALFTPVGSSTAAVRLSTIGAATADADADDIAVTDSSYEASPCLDMTNTWLGSALSNLSRIRIMVDQDSHNASVRYADLRSSGLTVDFKARMAEEIEQAIEICTSLNRETFVVSIGRIGDEGLTLETQSSSPDVLDEVISVLTFSE